MVSAGAAGEGIYPVGWTGGQGIVGTGNNWIFDDDQDSYVTSDADDNFSVVAGEVEQIDIAAGSEIITGSHAAANRDATEADATTGWTGASSGTVTSVTTATPYRGDYAIRLTSAANTSRIHYGFSVTAGVRYFISLRAKLISGGAAAIGVNSSTGAGNDILTLSDSFGSTDWIRLSGFWTAGSTATVYVMVRENSASNDSIVEIDDLSIKAVGTVTVQGDLTVKDDLIVDSQVFIGDSADTDITVGLTINHGANDDGLLTLKSSDVAHGITDQAETDTYALFKKQSGTSGALRIIGFGESEVGLGLNGYMGTANTTKSTAGRAAIELQAGLKSGTAAGGLSADGNMVGIRDVSGGTRFLFDVEGDSHQDVGTAWTNFDDFDDLEILNSLGHHLARPGNEIKEEFMEWVHDEREWLEEKGIVTFNDNGHHFLNHSRHNMAMSGAIRQLGAVVKRLVDDNAQLRALVEAK